MSMSCLPKPFEVPKSIANDSPKAMNYIQSAGALCCCAHHRRGVLLTHAKMIHQSSAVLFFKMMKRLMSLPMTKEVAKTKVIVVTTNTVLLDELLLRSEDILMSLRIEVRDCSCFCGVQVMVVAITFSIDPSNPRCFVIS
jgi:hypothetical protein